MNSHDVLQHSAHGGKRRYRCPECGTQNVRLFAVAKVLVDISDQPVWSGHFEHHLDSPVTDAWGFKTSAFVCEDCGHESRSWHRMAGALTTAVEWSEVKE